MNESAKSIVICCDGTSNTFGREHTNVRRVFDMVDVNGQIRYYDPGVGTLPSDSAGSTFGQKLSRSLGKTVAFGLTENILEAYKFLMQHYERGNGDKNGSKVFLFGYSRGALTVRRLAKFVDICGLPPNGNTNLIPYAWEAYQSYKSLEKIKGFNLNWKESVVPKRKRKHHQRLFSFRDISVECKPHIVGVWDTVRSVGTNWKGVSCRLSEGIQNARHALAYHEIRDGFRPEIWDEDGNRIKQRWFAGDHGDVGGGHRYVNGDKSKPITIENDLSVLSLVWMLEEVWMLKEAIGLRLDVNKDKFQVYKTAAENLRSNALGSREVNQKPWLVKYSRKKDKEKKTYVEKHESLKAYLEAREKI